MATVANTSHLEAELFAFPFSEQCFELGITTLERNRFGAYLGKSGVFAEALLEHLRPMARGLSIELLQQLRDRLWFKFAQPRPSPDEGWRLSLSRFLMEIGRERLVPLGHQVTLRSTPEWPSERATERWRWLSLALMPDAVIAGCAAYHRTEPVTDYVSIGPAHLGHFFQERGIAQPHLHLGAALPFEWLWTHLMSRIGHTAPGPAKLRSQGAIPFGAPEVFLDWLVTAALARLTMASFLAHRDWGLVTPPREPSSNAETFSPFVHALAARGQDEALHLRALAALLRGREPVPATRLRAVLRRLQRTAPPNPYHSKPPKSLQDIRRGDPLLGWLESTHGALPETRMMSRALGFLRDHPGETEFERLFCQYLRIRNRTYRHLVQQPGTAGLDWFSIHYQRISALRLGLGEQALMNSALTLESRGLPLRSLEVRTSPGSQWQDNYRLIQELARAPNPDERRGGSEPPRYAERGLVLHFVKERERRKGQRPHIDPRNLYGCRYGGYYQSRHQEALAIEGVLRRHPEVLVILRGMDTCNLELAVPTWVFLPILRRLRDSSRSAASALSPYGRIRPFQFTLHAGEDFRRLVEGLRRIHEPIEFGALHAGDRVGHAFALALSPEHWARLAPAVWQPREERLDDLLWELARYREEDMLGGAGRVDALHGEIDDLARDLYGDTFDGNQENLLRARELRHDPAFLAAVEYPFMNRAPLPTFMDKASQLTLAYLTDANVYFRGQLPMEVPVKEAELRMLHEAQRFLRQRFARLGITVEVNPSSNMLIGDLPLDEHPLFRLQPLASQPMPEGGPVLAALGDDDPVTFACNLPDDYCYLFYALLSRGVGVQEAHEWLDQLRRNALRARFTLPESVVRPHAAEGARPPAHRAGP